MDGFFKILENTSSELICTRLYVPKHRTLTYFLVYPKGPFLSFFSFTKNNFFSSSRLHTQRRRRWGGHVPPQVLGYQLTLFRPRGADYAHHITTGPPPQLFGRCGVSDTTYKFSPLFPCVRNSCDNKRGILNFLRKYVKTTRKNKIALALIEL